jgi:hypothetical protein
VISSKFKIFYYDSNPEETLMVNLMAVLEILFHLLFEIERPADKI